MRLSYEFMLFVNSPEGRDLQRECDKEQLTFPEVIKKMETILPEYAIRRQAQIEKEKRWEHMLSMMRLEHEYNVKYGTDRYPLTARWEEEYSTATEEDQRAMTELMHLYLSPKEKEFCVPFI